MDIEEVIEFIQKHKTLSNLIRIKVVVDARMKCIAYRKDSV